MSFWKFLSQHKIYYDSAEFVPLYIGINLMSKTNKVVFSKIMRKIEIMGVFWFRRGLEY